MRFVIGLSALSFMLTACGGQPLAEQAVVADSINFTDKDCAAQGLPIAIVFKNNTVQPTRQISWRFVVRRLNHSDNLTGLDMAKEIEDPNRRSDRIIQPGESFKVCSSAPEIAGYDLDSKELTYDVIVSSE